MRSFPENIHFIYPWRSYQKKVLEELEEHMKDRHLHIVAPPGSGKTVLGLEVAIRINRPTLILAPTLTIRNQWIERLCELFLATSQIPEWISTDIRNPSFLTVSTYQGLHAACLGIKEEASEENDESQGEEVSPEEISVKKQRSPKNSNGSKNFSYIINLLKEQKVKTIVVDEAHHLKSEWWATLISVKKQLNPIIVGLTATPPYDVNYTEWKRYLDLNGPIDSEISIPELISEGDLCPHQDHIYFSFPTYSEKEYIQSFRKNAKELFEEISNSFLFIEVLQKAPFWVQPEDNLEWIYDNLSVYSSTLLLLNKNRIEIPKIHFTILGVNPKSSIPAFKPEHLESLLNFFLFEDKLFSNALEEEKERLRNRLKNKGLIEKNRVNFSSNSSVSKLVTNSIGKLNSISKIVEIEYNHLKRDLRMVILSDYIRNEYLNHDETESFPKMGVIPVFELLRIQNKNHKRIGVLTGSIVLLPKNCTDSFLKLCNDSGFENSNSFIASYKHDYLLITPSSKLRNKIVQIVTRLFQEGEIEILIGTKSLLGEGWDAPAINSLVLASFVGSFVLSNQMRGRAIRTQKGNPQKTSNIWHLVCIDPTIPTGGNDVQLMSRRFKSFIGISNESIPTIQNGVSRLNILPESYNEKVVEIQNNVTINYAIDRENLKERWNNAIKNGTRIIEEIRLPYLRTEDNKGYSEKKRFYWNKTIAYLIADLGMALIGFTYAFLEGFFSNLKKINPQHYGFYLFSWFIIFICVLGKQTYKTLKLYIKYRDISKDIREIGEALLRSLINQGTVKTDIQSLSINSYHYEDGTVHCYLKGGTTFEQTAFIDCLQEIVDVIDNPKYIIVRKSKFISSFQRKDYHAVPEILGKNKKLAEHFQNQWKFFVGACDLIYTRNIHGRKILLNARIKSLSNKLADKPHSEQVSKWR